MPRGNMTELAAIDTVNVWFNYRGAIKSQRPEPRIAPREGDNFESWPGRRSRARSLQFLDRDESVVQEWPGGSQQTRATTANSALISPRLGVRAAGLATKSMARIGREAFQAGPNLRLPMTAEIKR